MEHQHHSGHSDHQHPETAHSGHDHHASSPHSGHNHHASSPQHGGHDHHAMMIDDFRRRFWVTLILTVPVMLLSPMIQHWLGIHLEFTGSLYVLATLSSV